MNERQSTFLAIICTNSSVWRGCPDSYVRPSNELLVGLCFLRLYGAASVVEAFPA